MRKNIVIVKRPKRKRSVRRRPIRNIRNPHRRNRGNVDRISLLLNPVQSGFMLIIVIIIVVISLVLNNNSSSRLDSNNSNNTNTNTNTNGFANTIKSKIKLKNNNNNAIIEDSNKNNTIEDNIIVEDNTNTNLEKDDNGNIIKIVLDSSCESKPKKNLSYFQYQDFKAHERIINPLLPPERSMETSYGIPINVPTRGEIGSFQQIGALYKETVNSEDMAPGNNTDSVVLSLFGKQTYPRSQKWTYYTSSDRNHQVKMPLSNKGRKCDSQYGCEEIVNDDLITVPGYNGVFRAVIYDYDAPKYIPCV